MRNPDKFRGCLIGGAVGDALGYPLEFLNESDIFTRYGKNGATEYILTGDVAEFTDDTQMTLFTANGLLLAENKVDFRGTEADYLEYFIKMYKEWYQTQVDVYPPFNKNFSSWLAGIPEMFSKRGPGTTCMSAINWGAKGTIEEPVNDSKGCGGVIRVAPIGLYFSGLSRYDNDFSDMLGAKAAAITHGHDLGYIPAAAMVHIIRAVTERDISLKEAVLESVKAVNKLFPDAEHISEFVEIMNKAVRLSESGNNDLTAIHQLGEGWVAEETLAIAVYCALKYENDFDKGIRAAVNHNGDSDSTGAVCGNILGAYVGYDAIPQKYKDNLELRDVILEMADVLCDSILARGFDPHVDDDWNYKRTFYDVYEYNTDEFTRESRIKALKYRMRKVSEEEQRDISFLVTDEFIKYFTDPNPECRGKTGEWGKKEYPEIMLKFKRKVARAKNALYGLTNNKENVWT